MSVNLKGFQQFVDAIGGIRVNVTDRLPIGGNSTNRTAVGGWIEPGKNKKLDGYHALWFARSRWSTDDFDRMRRQRCVIGAVVQQADPTTLVKQFPKIAAAAKDNMSTGIKQNALDAWVTLALRVKDAKVTSLPFDDTVVTSRQNPDFDLIQRLVRKALKDSMAPQVTETAAPSAGATPSATATPGGTKKKKSTAIDTSKAQSITEVC